MQSAGPPRREVLTVLELTSRYQSSPVSVAWTCIECGRMIFGPRPGRVIKHDSSSSMPSAAKVGSNSVIVLPDFRHQPGGLPFHELGGGPTSPAAKGRLETSNSPDREVLMPRYGPALYDLPETSRSGLGRPARRLRCRRGRHPTPRCAGPQHILWPISARHQYALPGPSFANPGTLGSECRVLSALLRSPGAVLPVEARQYVR